MSTFCNLPEVGGELTLHTHFVVREDAELLYGFATLAERAVFRALIKISGVGPKIALALLSGITVDQLKDAVDRGETGLLTKVPGIGKKTAERLVLELKGKLAGTGAATAAVPTSGARADVAAALIALGYSEREAAAATKKLPEDCTVNDGLRLALKSLTH
ncbi:MAG: Holliday junction branch migration protein RuvA [Sutterella wadsworthensis]